MSKEKKICLELVVFMYRTGKSMNNVLSYCGLVDARKSAFEKDLPVRIQKFCEISCQGLSIIA